MYMYQYMHIIRSIYTYPYALSGVSCVNIKGQCLTLRVCLFRICFQSKVLKDFFSLSFVVCHI
jgi:hypothetical protein